MRTVAKKRNSVNYVFSKRGLFSFYYNFNLAIHSLTMDNELAG